MAKENAEEKRKKKGCQPRHRVELNPLKAEADLRSLWNSEKHTKEQSCEVLAKLVDSRHITGRHFEHSALVQDIMVFLKERAEREGVCKVLKRCADALCFWSAAGALQQQRKSGQDTLRTGAQIRSPPAARPVRKLGGAGKALLLAGLVVLALAVAGCPWLVFSVKTGLVTWNASSIDKSAPVVGCAWLLPAVKTGLVDLNAALMANPAPSRMQDFGWLLVLLVLRAFGVWGVCYVAHQQQKLRPKRERACGAAVDTVCLNPGERRKGAGDEVATAASSKPPAALALFVLSLSSVLCSTYGAECSQWGVLPCTYGGCTFSKDTSGVLDRTGSCPTQGGQLWLDNKGITAMRDGIFDNMGACAELVLQENRLIMLPATMCNGLTSVVNIWALNNQLSTLAATTFNGCTRLKQLALAGNQLSMLPATIFDNLPSLTRIFLKCESFWGDSSCTTSGRDNPALTCTPLTQERIADLYYSGTSSGRDKFYKGPMVTCQYCTAGNAGPVGGTCTPCSAGKYSPNSGATACIDCEAGKFSAAVGATACQNPTTTPPPAIAPTTTPPTTVDTASDASSPNVSISPILELYSSEMYEGPHLSQLGSGSNRFAAIWSYRTVSWSMNNDVYVQVFEKTGDNMQPIGSASQLASSSDSEYRPSVASLGTSRAFVAYQKSFSIYGVIIGSDGRKIGTERQVARAYTGGEPEP